jgi:hypothetical protein
VAVGAVVVVAGGVVGVRDGPGAVGSGVGLPSGSGGSVGREVADGRGAGVSDGSPVGSTVGSGSGVCDGLAVGGPISVAVADGPGWVTCVPVGTGSAVDVAGICGIPVLDGCVVAVGMLDVDVCVSVGATGAVVGWAGAALVGTTTIAVGCCTLVDCAGVAEGRRTETGVAVRGPEGDGVPACAGTRVPPGAAIAVACTVPVATVLGDIVMVSDGRVGPVFTNGVTMLATVAVAVPAAFTIVMLWATRRLPMPISPSMWAWLPTVGVPLITVFASR